MIDYQAYENQLIVEDEDGEIVEQSASGLSLDDLAFSSDVSNDAEPIPEERETVAEDTVPEGANVAVNEAPQPADDNFSFAGQSAWLTAEYDRQQGLRQQSHEDGEHELSGKPQADLIFAQGVNHAKQQNFNTAAHNFRRAAMNGHGKAQFYLGLLFFKGQGVPSSPIHALCWLSLASCQGIKPANLAIDMLQGQLSEAERRKATEMAADKMEQIWAAA